MGKGLPESPAAPLQEAATKNTIETELGRLWGGADLQNDGGGENRVLAVVDGREIRASDLFQTYFMDNPFKMFDVLQNEILFILVGKEALKHGIVVGEKKVSRFLEEAIEDHRGRCAASVDEAITLEQFVSEYYGMTFDAYRELLRQTVVFNLLLERCVRYRELKQRRFRLGVVVAGDRKKAEEIRDKIEEGASFSVIAQNESLDPSASRGGILAPIPDDPGSPFYPLVESIRGLKKGEVGEIEQTCFSPTETFYRIIKLVDVIEPLRGSFSEIGPAVEASLEEDPVDLMAIRCWQTSLKEEHQIELRVP